jgi:hypothetical protein
MATGMATATAAAPRKRRTRKNKYITLHSPFLMKETKHELIGEPIENGGKRQQWARCTRTHHSQLVDLDELEAKAQSKDEDFVISRDSAVLYNPKNEYSIGDTISHDVWQAVGRVIRKEITSNGSHAIVVQFEDRTEKRLIEKLQLI